MIDLKKTDSTFQKCSLDDSDKNDLKYMTESCIPVNKFDNVKDRYLKENGLCCEQTLASNDALFYHNNHWYFFEFKNGVLNNTIRAEVKMKLYDSLLIFSDILNLTIKKTRECVSYVFVYNENAKCLINDKDNKKDLPLTSGNSKWNIISSVAKKAKLNPDLMKMNQYRGAYFKDVEVLNKIEFEHYIKRNHFQSQKA